MSRRIVWPYAFTLLANELVEAYRSGATRDLAKAQGLLPQGAPVGAALGIPTALRWSTHPWLGIPRQPFAVYRRDRAPVPAAVIRQVFAQPVSVAGTADLAFPAGTGLVHLASVAATPSSGGGLDVAAYDLYGRVLPAQDWSTNAAGTHLFVGPGIAGLRVSGSGTVGPVLAVNQDDYANLPDWQLTQVVGLPTQPGQFAPHYDSAALQGYVTPSLPGFKAAVLRLLIAELLRGQPQPSPDAQFPLPAWPPSSPTGYLQNLCGPDNLLALIGECLTVSVDADITKTQSLFTKSVTLDGIKQANLPGAQANPGQTSTALLPVVSVAMLGVSTDSDAATGLGYGTVDFPALGAGKPAETPVAGQPGTPPAAAQPVAPPVAPPVAATQVAAPPVLAEHADAFNTAASVGAAVTDFMVTAPYVLPLGIELTLAALSQTAPAVQTADGFSAEIAQQHATIARDDTAQVAVELSWQDPAVPQAYALLASRKPLTSVVLNAPRPAAVGGYDPFVGLPPTSPDPNVPADEQLPSFKDAAGQLPLDGTATTHYLAAGIDVFGQWSAWTEAEVTLAAGPIAQPGLGDVSLALGALPTTGTAVPSELVIEVMWDWTDRSPGVIRISGEFIAPGTPLGPAFLTGLAMGNDVAAGPPLMLTWQYGASDPTTVAPGAVLPTITSGHTGTVELITDTSGVADNQAMRYRVTLQGLALDFAAATELDLAIYATATERVRPGEWSDSTLPAPPGYTGRIARVHDPFPPPVTFTPPSISWTALPDADNRARGMLEWASDPAAAGYMVWESTEGALLTLLSPGAPDPDPTASLVTRGATLKALVAANYEQSLSSFGRLNTDPIVGSRTEIELPGNASILYAYMVSAVSATGVEADRAPQIAVFGVPRRIVPGQPQLRLRPSTAPSGIEVIALPAIAGETPAGYRVLRVRNAALAADTGLMGPPKILESDPGWSPYTDQPLRGGTTVSGQRILDTAATPSWYPYRYRVIAIGDDDPANGRYRGESLPSAVQSAYLPPPDPPMLVPQPLAQGNGAALLVASLNLPIPASALGPSLVELLRAEPDPDNPGRTVQTVVLSSAPDAIAEGTLSLPPHAPPPFPRPPVPPPPGRLPLPPQRPPIPVPPVNRGPALARSTPATADASWILYVLVPYASADVGTYSVRATDPLQRRTTTTF
ncbi:MAG TPA: hypothetical protein VFW09_03965 [Solirubrobacteraceae bacterium]|nr:hypothetical protein [Solirubrobacteraceae bacterium]